MRNIQDIYEVYKIMPNLALHQKRVAAVAKTLTDALQIESTHVISACLLHDMGNMLKFRLQDFPEFLEPQGLEYWRQVQEQMFARYGRDEHAATIAIAEELAVSSQTMNCLRSVGFSRSIENLSAPLAHQICAYADMRVGPYGVISLTERFEDGRKRYAHRTDRKLLEQERIEALYQAAYDIENNIFSSLRIRPSDITDSTIQQTISELSTYIIV